VEVNATFYKAGFSPHHVRRWLSDVSENDRFRFTLKLHRAFTHTFSATADDVRLLARRVEILENAGRFCGLLMQFPIAFQYSFEHLTYLSRLVGNFGRHRIFVELRHRSLDTPSSIDAIHSLGAVIVNVDLPQLPEHVRFSSRLWDGTAYFRMMGVMPLRGANPGAWSPVGGTW
jgi:uncharacterized protein YecE (DUF72 family)